MPSSTQSFIPQIWGEAILKPVSSFTSRITASVNDSPFDMTTRKGYAWPVLFLRSITRTLSLSLTIQRFVNSTVSFIQILPNYVSLFFFKDRINNLYPILFLVDLCMGKQVSPRCLLSFLNIVIASSKTASRVAEIERIMNNTSKLL